MVLRLVPGADRDNALRVLGDVLANLTNTYNLRGERYRGYCEWVNNTVRQLRPIFQAADLEAMVLTRRYWALQSLAVAEGTVVLNELLNIEVEERRLALEEAADVLKGEIKHWAQAGVLVVPDTSMFIQHAEKLENWDLRKLLGTAELNVTVLLPIIVVDELDRLKESKDKYTRWRAGHSLGFLDERISPGKKGILVAADPQARIGEVSVELVLDPPGHVRLPIADDEIVDRALAIQAVAGTAVTVLTYDTGLAMRGKQAGVRVRKLSQPLDQEPLHTP